MRLFAFVALALLLTAGCQMADRQILANPGENQVVQVKSGDRLDFELEENITTGFSWDYTCDDPDVEVQIEHLPAETSGNLCGAPGRARVHIHVHRGYDGPSSIRFFYRRPWEKKPPAKEFTIALFRRTGDAAFWE